VTCHEILDVLGDYLAEELARETRELFVRHLAECPSCRAYLDAYEKTILLSRRTLLEGDVPEPPPELVAAVLASVRGWPPRAI
jgi:predicted anti-sigma-YlaC factor YlaD